MLARMNATSIFDLSFWSRNRDRVQQALSRRARQHLTELHPYLVIGENARRIEALRDIHRGKRAVIIGNGPSLRIADLSLLQGEITFAANKIFLAFEHTPWRPTYYNVEDPLVIQQNSTKINELRGFLKLLNRNEAAYLSVDESTVLYDLLVLPQVQFPAFSANPHRGLYCGYSVCISSIQWAWFMGVTEIYLIGVDFSFTVPPTETGGRLTSTGEVNHFVAGYRTPGELWYPPKLEEQRAAFAHCHDWLSSRGVSLINATRGGKLDVLPRVDFEEVFGATKA
jgi:hypothetical protein